MLTGSDVRRIRQQRGWSQQELARRASVNKAYISEFETGVRPELPTTMLDALAAALLEPAGRVQPRLVRRRGHARLVLRDADGNEFVPRDASLHWTDDQGTSYSMFVGERDL